MKVRLERTGGVAGTRLEVVLDTAEMSPERAERVETIAAHLEGHGLPSKTALSGAARDAFRYTVTLDDGSGERRIEADDLTIDSKLRDLVDILVREGRRPRATGR